MASLVLKDLESSEEMDHKALAELIGGHGWGRKKCKRYFKHYWRHHNHRGHFKPYWKKGWKYYKNHYC